jgi:uncharacterized protein (DUF2236 family)
LECEPGARLYGCRAPPTSEAEMEAKLAAMQPRLKSSPVIFEFLEIMRTATILPPLMRPAQTLMIRAAVSIVPLAVRHLLGIGQPWSLRRWEGALVRQAGNAANRLRLDSSPAARASLRMGLPLDYLWKAAAPTSGR